MNILITGATGFIGTAIIKDLQQEQHSIAILTRDKKHASQQVDKIYESVDDIPNDSNFDIIINLAGAPISKRWTASYKQTLIDSRINTTKAICSLIKRLNTKPKTLISASAIGYYGNQGNNTVTEDTQPQPEFTHTLCSKWEQEAQKVQEMGTNVIIIRLGVVLGQGSGILKETAPIFKMCLGGKIGSGEQYLSWVHIDDVVRAVKFLYSNNYSGVYNLTAPNPVTNADWTKVLSKALKRPAIFPLPSFMVKLIFGEMGEALLLGSQRVMPEKLTQKGFEFKYSQIDNALASIFR